MSDSSEPKDDDHYKPLPTDKPHFPYLTEKQFHHLNHYKHFAPKTPYELFMLDNVTTHVEKKLLPKSWSPNAVTILGNLMLPFAGVVCLFYGGLSYAPTDHSLKNDDGTYVQSYLPSWCFWFAAFATQWFSWFDMMDGQRARRLKAGTPIGRLVDEAGDAVQYLWVAMIIGYMMRLSPGWGLLSFGVINLPEFSMEIKFMFTGSLTITSAGDGLGPVEIEVLFAVIFALSAFFGVEGLGNPVEDTIGFAPAGLEWKHLLMVLFFILLSMFTLENLLSSFKTHFWETSRIMMNPLLSVAIAAFSGYLNLYTFEYESVIFFLLHSQVFTVSLYRLLLANMTKSKFRIIGVEHILAVAPAAVQLSHLTRFDLSEHERSVTYFCTVAAFALFYFHIYLLSKQYVSRGVNRKFWTLSSAQKES